MKEIAISEFKAKCLAILNEVEKTKRAVRVVRRGKPLAEVFPPSPTEREDVFALMKGEVDIVGDIISPASDPEEWEVLRD